MPNHYMDSFLKDDYDTPISMAEYLQGEGLRLKKELEDAAIHAELKRQFWVDHIGKAISAADGRGTTAVGRLVAVVDGVVVPQTGKGYNGDAVALRLNVDADTGVAFWPAGMCRVIALQD